MNVMGKIVVMDESDVRRIIKDELRDFYANFMKTDFVKLNSEITNLKDKMYRLENTLGKLK